MAHYALQSWKSLLVMLAVALVATLLGGCTERVRYVAVPTLPPAPVTPVLHQCAEHAARAQKQAFGDTFRGLQFDRAGLVLAMPTTRVGRQEVGAVYDGEGQWYGRPDGTRGEWRSVRFHCMVSPLGNVVYSFVRAY